VLTLEANSRAGGAIYIGIAVLLAACAYLWDRYSVNLQQSAARMMRRDSDSPYTSSGMERSRVYGVIFFAIISVITFAVGVKALM
jgi:hypothetical protein